MAQDFKSADTNTKKLEQVEAALRESELRFRAIFNQTFQFMGIIKPDGTLVEANRRALEFGGLTSAEVIGRLFWEASWWDSPKTQAILREAIAHALKGKSIRCQVNAASSNNTVATIDFSIKPFRDETGQIVLLVAEGRIFPNTDVEHSPNHQNNEQLEHETVSPVQWEMKEQNQLYRDIVNNMQFGLVVWHLEDPNDITSFRLVTTNPAASRLTGLTLEQEIGKRIVECFPKMFLERKTSLELYAEVAKSGRAVDQYQVYYGDERIPGSYFSVKVFPLPNLCIGIAFDNITQGKQAERALLESERRWATLAKMSPVGIFRTDLSGNYHYVNKRWCEIAGLSVEDALGKGWRRAVHPEDLERIDTQVKPEEYLPLEYEFRFVHPNGRINWVFSQAVPETEDDGKVIGYVGTVTNITQHKQAEQALRESEERFHAMAENAPVMIWVSGVDQLRTYFNSGWLEFTGRTMEQELGNSWTQGVHPEDIKHCLETQSIGFDAREPFMMEYRLRRFDGEYRWILDKGTPRWNPDGSFAGYIGSCIDISDRKEAEIALQQRAEELTRTNIILAQTTTLLKKRNDELDQFAYVASHDLKAPLRAIASLSEWMEEDLADILPEENQHQMRLLRGRVRRMESLINGLLEYSRVGRTQTPSVMVNVTALLREVIDLLDPPQTFTIEVEPGMPIFEAKRVPLQQVFSNLIGNAIKHHSRPDGYVKVSVKDQGHYYEFAVCDDGPGIAPEYHNKIFNIFQTLEARDQKESTGVGLAIVKKIIETEAGTMTMKSQVGVGSTFSFTWLKQPVQ
ncbi:PAS domain S-box protein [Mastigocladopsis repens]|uniref:PAS domain S-box protein n=1 Tax=Mastigocladopsis repens TaxID=221287 RepID=UPI0002FD55CF|nr:PAS domain S-box protein [Mastigocladopsis repens]